MSQKWQLAFNPEDSWSPLNSSPEFGLNLGPRVALIEDYLSQSASIKEISDYRQILVLLPRGVHDQNLFLNYGNESTNVKLIFQESRQTNLDKKFFAEPDFEDWSISEFLENQVLSDTPTLIICPLLFPTLLDPRPLLRALRKILRKNPNNRLLNLSTSWNPDPERWQATNFTEIEFQESMEQSGFKLEHLNVSDKTQQPLTDVLHSSLFSCSSTHYAKFLQDNGVSPGTKILNVTTESVYLPRNGGIGKYCENFDLSDTPSIFLLAVCGVEIGKTRENGNLWVGVDEFPRGHSAGQSLYEEVFLAFLQVLFIFDEIELIEYQDYLGVGYRIAQAKQSGIIPKSISLTCVGHGNQFYVQSGFDDFARSEPPHIPVFERISAELADLVVFPTRFLQEMYTRQLMWSLDTIAIRPHPNNFQDGESSTMESRVSTIVFLGKATKFKGFEVFVEAIQALEARNELSSKGITNLVVLGSDTPREELTSLPNIDTRFEYPNAEILTDRISELAPYSLFVLPYLGDNAPLMVQEVIKEGSRFILGNAGGIPEVIPPEIAKAHLVDTDANSLAIRILSEISKPSQLRPNRKAIDKFYKSQNKEFNSYFVNFRQTPNYASGREKSFDISIIVTMFNPTIKEVEDCISGINNLVKQPTEVIFADDCSSDENYRTTERLIRLNLMCRFKIVRQDKNLGLPACRNLALQYVETDYFMALDIDDVPHPRYTRLLQQAFVHSSGDIVTSGSRYFYDGSDFRQIQRLNHGQYLPTSESLTLSLTTNSIGHCCAGYRTKFIRQIGGWDESSRAMWEDWQLFIKSSLLGAKISIIPVPMLFYRVRNNSMARTYKSFPAFLRIMSELTFIPRGQRFEFLSALVSARRLADAPKEVIYLPQDVVHSTEVKTRGTLTRELRALLSYHADFHPALSLSRKLYRSIKRAIHFLRS
jgi:glycosyltransferase involved in cell wall biosynthesis